MKLNKFIFLRLSIYILGIFFLALGVAFSVNSNLGVSPANALPFVISKVSGIKMGTCVIFVFSFYVFLQFLILKKDFEVKNLLQVLFSVVFGYFVDFTKLLLGDFSLPTYPGQLLMMFLGIFFIGFGITLYINMDIIPVAVDGFTQSLTKKLKGFSFHNMKIIVDISNVVLAAAVSFIFLGNVEGLREGTVLAAVLCGKVMGLLNKYLEPVLRKLCYEDNSAVEIKE